MDFNKYLFPSPICSYTSFQLLGKVLYIPRDSNRVYMEQRAPNTPTLPTAPPASPKPPKSPKTPKSPPKDKKYLSPLTVNSPESTENSPSPSPSPSPSSTIPCLYLPYNKGSGSTRILVYFHANAEDLGTIRSFLEELRDNLQIHVLGMEYPGYGIYAGSPTAEGIMRDAESLIYFISHVMGRQHADIILMGRSIGTGPATYLASKYTLAGLILISPYTSIRSVVKHLYGRFMAYLIKDRFCNLDYIGGVLSPIFILHGMKDTTIPYTQSLKLIGRVGNVYSQLISPPHMDHNNYNLKSHLIKPLRRWIKAGGITVHPRRGEKGNLVVPGHLFIKPLGTYGNIKIREKSLEKGGKNMWYNKIFHRNS